MSAKDCLPTTRAKPPECNTELESGIMCLLLLKSGIEFLRFASFCSRQVWPVIYPYTSFFLRVSARVYRMTFRHLVLLLGVLLELKYPGYPLGEWLESWNVCQWSIFLFHFRWGNGLTFCFWWRHEWFYSFVNSLDVLDQLPGILVELIHNTGY